jgi:hypothetical protein
MFYVNIYKYGFSPHIQYNRIKAKVIVIGLGVSLTSIKETVYASSRYASIRHTCYTSSSRNMDM